MTKVLQMKPKQPTKFYAVAAIEGGVVRTPAFKTKAELLKHLETRTPKKRWTILPLNGEPAKTRETITRLGY